MYGVCSLCVWRVSYSRALSRKRAGGHVGGGVCRVCAGRGRHTSLGSAKIPTDPPTTKGAVCIRQMPCTTAAAQAGSDMSHCDHVTTAAAHVTEHSVRSPRRRQSTIASAWLSQGLGHVSSGVCAQTHCTAGGCLASTRSANGARPFASHSGSSHVSHSGSSRVLGAPVAPQWQSSPSGVARRNPIRSASVGGPDAAKGLMRGL